MTPAPWLPDLLARPVAQVAEALGLSLRPIPPPGSVWPCPSCGALRRGTDDHRGPVGLSRDGLGWRCFRCDAHGSTVDLAALLVLGHVPTCREDWAQLREACASQGLCESAPGAPCLAAPRRPLPPPPVEAPPPARPPAAEVEQLWASCLPVLDDVEVTAWIQGRGLDPGDVELHDLARALPVDLEVPAWARFRGETWGAQGYRLVLPMYDATGQLASLRARAVRSVAGPKAIAPAGFEVRGLVLADGLARQVLAGEALEIRRVVVAEGEPDCLTWATYWSDADDSAPAVFGVIAGSWAAELAARIPDGAEVTIASHHDRAGDGYAAAIVASLAGRCALRRWTPAARADDSTEEEVRP